MFPIIHLPYDASDLPEQLGTKRKFWYRGPEERRYLFKEGRPNTGENWAEKVCCEIAELLRIPHATYDFAEWNNNKGVVTPTFVPAGGRMVFGNELLAQTVKDYPHTTRYRVRQHTLPRVLAVMRSQEIGLPIGYTAPEELRYALDIFVGYLMLDALVGNQDRHHENWGLIITEERIITLAPTYDHASSLGRNELDDERLRRLTTKDQGSTVEKYAERALSAFFSSAASNKPLSTLAAFQEAAKFAPRAGAYWLNQLRRTSVAEYEAIFQNIPVSEISGPASQFALKMLEVNSQRLLRT